MRIRESRHVDQHSYHPDPSPGLKLAHPKIYNICEQLKSMKGSVLMIQNCRISMKQGNNRIRITRRIQ